MSINPYPNLDKSFVNGTFVSKSTGESLVIKDKYSGELMATIPYAHPDVIDDAIKSSCSAFETMKFWTAEKRQEMLGRLLGLVKDHQEDLIKLIVREAGKPVDYATGETERALITLRTAMEETLRFDGEKVPLDYRNGKGRIAFTGRFPVGPVTAISPFNFPLNLAMHKIAPALAVGNPVVLKPSPFTPITALLLARLVDEAGYPKGALNVVIADNETSQTLVEDHRMKIFSFTGSPRVGWKLKGLAGKKKVILELGGNAAVVVDKSTENLKEVAKTIAYGTFLYAGQICISTQRIIVHRDIIDEFTNLLVTATKEQGVGDPSDNTNNVGPIINSEHLKRIASWVDEAVSKGAKVVLGGEIIDSDKNLYAPTLLRDVKKGMKVLDEEVFGPIGVIQSFSGMDEAIQMVNDSRYGLQAGWFTENISQVKKAFNEVEVGGLMINNIPGFRIDSMPYGGVKDSGLGREGLIYTMQEMTEPKLLVF